jgi:2-oxoisovalerate dehydrogenase E1 component
VPRLSGHSSQDNQAYKSAATVAAERERDPLPKLRDYLVPALLTAAEWDTLADEVEQTVRAGAAEAQAQPDPQPASATRFVFAEADRPSRTDRARRDFAAQLAADATPHVVEPIRINMVQAVQRVLDEELALNPHLVIFGEDVGQKGGVHTATSGLQKKYGSRRVFDTSLSEEGIIGRAVGMALAGLRPVPEIQFRKYADPALEQLNNLGTLRWRSQNNFAAPVVVRMPVGFGRKLGDPWHSVTNEAQFAHAVGWQLAFPSNAEDAVGLLRTALRGDNPTIFFEHRAQLDAAWARRPYPGGEYVLPFGAARVLSEGDDLTVVTWGALVERCVQAAAGLDAAVEIIDLRTIIPWDMETVLRSVQKTAKCLVVHEDIGVAGFGAEIAATIMETIFLDLDAPVVRVTTPAVPVPFSVGLMHAVVPTVALIRQRMQELIAY